MANIDDVYSFGTPQQPPTAVGSVNDDGPVSSQCSDASPIIYHTDKSNSCTRSCSYGCYSFFGTLFCFKKNQTLMSKLGITWLWIFLIPIAIGLVLGLYVFAPYTFLSSPGDQRSLMGKYDSFFCDAMKVDSNGRFNGYLLSHSPEILQNNRSYTNVDLPNITIPSNSYREWNFYLLQGSVVEFELCNTMQLEFFLLKGEDNYKNWKKNPSNCGCSIQHVSYLKSSDTCIKMTAPDAKNGTHNFSTSVGSTDEYYLVFQNPSDKENLSMSSMLYLNRSTYNIYDNVKNSCYNNYTCDLSLGFVSYASFVYVSTESHSFNVKNKVHCNPTWAVYLIMFGAIPMIAGFFISLALFIMFMHCPGAWEGVERARPWDEGKGQQNKESILDTLPEDGKKQRNEKEKPKKKKNGRLFGEKSGYETLDEDESREESMDTLPRNSPPPRYDSMLPPAGETSAAATGAEHEGANGTASVEVHTVPE